jgi:hypothetical protein
MKPSELELGQKRFITTSYGIAIWKRIQAFDAKNWDGTHAGYKKGTEEGDRLLLEKKIVPFDKSMPVMYTNFW